MDTLVIKAVDLILYIKWPVMLALFTCDKYLLTNRLNQDCLENFFSIMRSRGGHSDNPNTVELRAAYRSVCIDSHL